MIWTLLALAAGAGEHEENTFALVANGLEWATPDLRIELDGEGVGTVLSWPVVPVSISLLRGPGCKTHLLLEPYVEPQVRLGGGGTRLVAGSQTVWLPAGRGPGLLADGGAVHEGGAWGWAAGGGLVWTGGAAKGVRGRFALRSRYIEVAGRSRADLSLDVGLPISGKGWGRIAGGRSVDDAHGWCAAAPVERRPDLVDRPPDLGCDPIGCGLAVCGTVPDGCGGTLFCGSCDAYELDPICDPEGCMPGMCGFVPDGCGGQMFCGACEPELPICDPVSCMPGMCGEVGNGCGGTMNCGPCEEACEPLDPCLPGVCGVYADGCGGEVSCGECPDPYGPCVPMDCMPGTCGVQPDGCGGSLDCGECAP